MAVDITKDGDLAREWREWREKARTVLGLDVDPDVPIPVFNIVPPEESGSMTSHLHDAAEELGQRIAREAALRVNLGLLGIPLQEPPDPGFLEDLDRMPIFYKHLVVDDEVIAEVLRWYDEHTADGEEIIITITDGLDDVGD